MYSHRIRSELGTSQSALASGRQVLLAAQMCALLCWVGAVRAEPCPPGRAADSPAAACAVAQTQDRSAGRVAHRFSGGGANSDSPGGRSAKPRQPQGNRI